MNTGNLVVKITFSIDASRSKCFTILIDQVTQNSADVQCATSTAGNMMSDSGLARRAVRSEIRNDRLSLRQSQSSLYHMLDGRWRSGTCLSSSMVTV